MCLGLGRKAALWADVVPRFQQARALGALLDCLLPRIMAGQLQSLAPEVMQVCWTCFLSSPLKSSVISPMIHAGDPIKPYGCCKEPTCPLCQQWVSQYSGTRHCASWKFVMAPAAGPCAAVRSCRQGGRCGEMCPQTGPGNSRLQPGQVSASNSV